MTQPGSEVDLSEFDAAPRLKGPRCSVGAAIDLLPPERAEKVLAALASPLTNRAIAERLSEWSGLHVRVNTVGRHRREDCACG